MNERAVSIALARILCRATATAVAIRLAYRALSARSCENARTVRMPPIASSAVVPATAYASCIFDEWSFTRPPSSDEAIAIGGTATSTSSVSIGDV